MERQPLEELLAAFARKSLSSGVQLWKTLIAGGYTFEEFEKWLNEQDNVKYVSSYDNGRAVLLEKHKRNKEAFQVKPTRKCPSCGGVLKVFSLTQAEKTDYPDMNTKWECCKTCSHDPCGYTEYLSEDIETIIEQTETIKAVPEVINSVTEMIPVTSETITEEPHHHRVKRTRI